MNYINIAKSSGFNTFEKVFSLDQFDEAIDKSLTNDLYFIHVKCSYDEACSRPPATKLSKANLALTISMPKIKNFFSGLRRFLAPKIKKILKPIVFFILKLVYGSKNK